MPLFGTEDAIALFRQYSVITRVILVQPQQHVRPSRPVRCRLTVHSGEFGRLDCVYRPAMHRAVDRACRSDHSSIIIHNRSSSARCRLDAIQWWPCILFIDMNREVFQAERLRIGGDDEAIGVHKSP